MEPATRLATLLDCEADSPADALFRMTDSEAAQVVQELKRKADQYWGIDPRCSAKLAQRIIRIGEINQITPHIALGKLALGDAIKLFDSLDKAWKCLAEAEALYREVGDLVGAASTWIGRLSMSVNLGRVDEALDQSEWASRLFEAHDERIKLIRLRINTAVVLEMRSEYPQALAIYEKLLPLVQSFGRLDKNYQPIIHAGMASVYNCLGNYQDALTYYDAAYHSFSEEGQRQRAIIAKYNRGYVLQTMGRYSEALHVFHTVQELAQGEFTVNTLYAKRAQVECYLFMKNRSLEAYELAREVVSGFERLDDTFEVARTLGYSAIAEATLGRFDQALATLEKAEKLFASLNSTSWLALTLIRKGRINLEYQNFAAARLAANDAAKLATACQSSLLIGLANLLLADALTRLALLDEAEAAVQTALELGVQLPILSMQYDAYVIRGQIAEKQGQAGTAVGFYERAIGIVADMQHNLTISIRPGFLEELRGAFMRLMHLRLTQGDLVQAQELLEAGKTQTSLDYLFNRERINWQRDDEASQELLTKLNSLRYQYRGLFSADPAVITELASNEQANRSALTLHALETQIRETIDRIYLNYQNRQGYNPAQNVTLAAIQQEIDEETALIEYYCDQDTWWAFVITHQTFTAHKLDITTREITSFLNGFRANLAHTWAIYEASASPTVPKIQALAERVRQLSIPVYRGLFGNILRDIADFSRLIIVPYRDLHYLPFNILFTGQEYVVQRAEISILPSAQLICRPLTPRTKGARILAFSGDPKLVHLFSEAEAVNTLFDGDVFHGANANGTVLNEPPCQILHIAAHGAFRFDIPELSYLELADGNYYMDDFLQKDFNYELVTLSACETGRAAVLGNDEPIGIGRGLLLAGAQALMVSLWRIDDAATTAFFRDFYRYLKSGEAKSSALCKVQTAILQQTPDLHPFFWGAFQIIGNRAPLSP